MTITIIIIIKKAKVVVHCISSRKGLRSKFVYPLKKTTAGAVIKPQKFLFVITKTETLSVNM